MSSPKFTSCKLDRCSIVYIYSIGLFTIHTILSHLYRHHSSLVNVVSILAPSCTILDDDTELYHRMCTTTLVACNKEDVFGSRNVFNDPIQVKAISHLIREVAEVGLEVYIHKWNCSMIQFK